MFERGDFIWCPEDSMKSAAFGEPAWSEDWGIVIRVRDGYKKNKYYIRWLHDKVTCEDEDWAHNHCQLVAGVK
jgi:hypothetical protein|tara:strand:+ start:1387 stop:1605 length:219 start_codon:yes stop_codon:yes gene_type:complete